MFEYNAKLDRIIDGDTVDAMVDLGFGIWKKLRIRFYGINTPETRTRDLEEKKRGLAAKERLHDILIKESKEPGVFKLKSYGVGKYGRCLGELFVDGLEDSVNRTLINEGHGVEYFGGKR
tara:strand:- start:13214 stop:13573 length:360 start_codon:yes stop_codon:yes gene_type:complete